MRRMSRAVPFAALALLLAACGGGGNGGDGDDDTAAPDAEPAAPDARPLPPDGMPCPESDPQCWLEEYEREVVGKLSGYADIAPGTRLAARRSDGERETTRVYLEQELTRWGLTPVRDPFDGGINILATLPATNGATGPLVVVGGHFDSVNSPAAADDGTGTALVLAAARYFSTVPVRTKPIVFALFDAEELGLLGSHHHAETLFTDDTAVDSVHVFDMISFDGDRDGAVELWSPTPSLQAVYEEHAAAAEPPIPVRVVEFASSDHDSYLDRGFVTVGMSEEFVSGDHTPHYHQPTDTYDKIDFPYLATATRLAFAVIADVSSQ
jgi:hypothetical protein